MQEYKVAMSHRCQLSALLSSWMFLINGHRNRHFSHPAEVVSDNSILPNRENWYFGRGWAALKPIGGKVQRQQERSNRGTFGKLQTVPCKTADGSSFRQGRQLESGRKNCISKRGGSWNDSVQSCVIQDFWLLRGCGRSSQGVLERR